MPYHENSRNFNYFLSRTIVIFRGSPWNELAISPRGYISKLVPHCVIILIYRGRGRVAKETTIKKNPCHVSPNDITSSLRFQSPQLTCFPNVRSLMSSTEKLSNNYHGHESVARCNFRSFHSGQERPDACEWTMIITVQWIQGAMITGT